MHKYTPEVLKDLFVSFLSVFLGQKQIIKCKGLKKSMNNECINLRASKNTPIIGNTEVQVSLGCLPLKAGPKLRHKHNRKHKIIKTFRFSCV